MKVRREKTLSSIIFLKQQHTCGFFRRVHAKKDPQISWLRRHGLWRQAGDSTWCRATLTKASRDRTLARTSHGNHARPAEKAAKPGGRLKKRLGKNALKNFLNFRWGYKSSFQKNSNFVLYLFWNFSFSSSSTKFEKIFSKNIIWIWEFQKWDFCESKKYEIHKNFKKYLNNNLITERTKPKFKIIIVTQFKYRKKFLSNFLSYFFSIQLFKRHVFSKNFWKPRFKYRKSFCQTFFRISSVFNNLNNMFFQKIFESRIFPLFFDVCCRIFLLIFWSEKKILLKNWITVVEPPRPSRTPESVGFGFRKPGVGAKRLSTMVDEAEL